MLIQVSRLKPLPRCLTTIAKTVIAAKAAPTVAPMTVGAALAAIDYVPM